VLIAQTAEPIDVPVGFFGLGWAHRTTQAEVGTRIPTGEGTISAFGGAVLVKLGHAQPPLPSVNILNLIL